LSGIPPRPAETHLPDGSIESGDLFEILAHQHAVAKRAYETLKSLDCLEPGQAFAVPTPCNLLSCPRCSALHDIDASGWKP
jgi:hypothetical protein